MKNETAQVAGSKRASGGAGAAAARSAVRASSAAEAAQEAGAAAAGPAAPVRAVASAAVGGRGARERILNAAMQLFYERGIHATGVAALVEAAHVSTRTFYQQFESKNALVEEYLRRFETEDLLDSERQLRRDDLPPVERLLAIFDALKEMLRVTGAVRGCPLHNATVEAAGEMPEVARFVEQHKRDLLAQLTAVSAEAGALDPDSLARQITVVFEGANALAATCNDLQVIDDAKAAAATLIRAAL